MLGIRKGYTLGYYDVNTSTPDRTITAKAIINELRQPEYTIASIVKIRI